MQVQSRDFKEPGLLTTVDFTLALTFPKNTSRRLATHS